MSDRGRTAAEDLIGRRALLSSLGSAGARATERLLLARVVRPGLAAGRVLIDGALESAMEPPAPERGPGTRRTQEGP